MIKHTLSALLVLGLAACTSTGTASTDTIDDPYEGFNRQMFAFNNQVDTYALGPAADAYKAVTPEFARDRVSDFLSNLRSPVVLVNDLLQGEGERAAETFGRFMVNTTLGIGGLWDVAAYDGLEGHREDFGQTLAVWGVDSGPYLVLPLLGPTTPRGLVGRGVDQAFDPLTWTEFKGDRDLDEDIVTGRMVIGGLNARAALDEEIDQLNAQPEPYVALRRIYSSQRQAEIRNGKINEEEAYDDLPDFDEFDE